MLLSVDAVSDDWLLARLVVLVVILVHRQTVENVPETHPDHSRDNRFFCIWEATMLIVVRYFLHRNGSFARASD